ncbi:MAG: UDP-N-acetylglucosamine 1-carboxyvinyltransferase [Microbacterium gubbeenense]|uniref:UDP-N-acetylglucosamine 1-carboxyvinyltransferase n=1 Tax=Microbacterium gubbeenense TaxID=159896 RepID=UPI000403DAEF|nr:UDP-N-acetylglucosamine 1-carboxyvinyltransferase [Microbacterium gubbeenense]
MTLVAGTDAQKTPAKGDVLEIRGGQPLRGQVDVKGAKNLATKAMVASLLGETPSTLRDVPEIRDVEVVRSLLEVHGVSVTEGDEPGSLVLDPTRAKSAGFEEIDAHAGSSRIPILFCGPLLHVLGQAFIPDLGGCRIGDRPIDFHLEALRNFGAIVDKQPNGIRLSAPDGLHGANIELPYPSVGATEQVLLTAVRAKGVTELRNAAIEPEIMDLIGVLQKMGAIISYEPNRVIFIEGVSELKGYDHRSLFDRNEAASWACAALATDGEIFVKGARQYEMLTFLNVFRKTGGSFDITDDGITFRRSKTPLTPVMVETDVHPGFMTDWQQPLIVALTQAEGVSIVHETVYENRLGFTSALNQMGSDIVVHHDGLKGAYRRVPERELEQAAVITGPTPLKGADIVVPDLRGGFAYVIAALAAEGTSVVSNVGIIRRGYEKFFDKLIALGADFDVVG